VLICFSRAAGVAALAVIFAPIGSHAEEWAPTGKDVQGDLVETDLGSLSRTGDIVHSWARGTPVHPLKDIVTGKTFVVSIDERFDDCAQHRFRFGTSVHRDRHGDVVSTTNSGGLWQTLVPGSVAETVARSVCRATEKLPDEPFLPNIADGNWAVLGPSADKKYVLSVNMDKVVSIGKDMVVAVTKSEFGAYQIINSFPVKYIVTAYAIDCARATSVNMGSDVYMSAAFRSETVRVPKDKLAVQPIPPGSFLATSYHQICASAAPEQKTAETGSSAPDEGSFSTGTAWATNKGYLITASHVVDGAKRIGIYSDGQAIGRAEVVADDPANDLAVLKLVTKTERKLDILPLADHGASLGRRIFTLGYPAPDVLGQTVKMTAGEVSGMTGAYDDARELQLTAPVQPGNSGGPVIGWDGAVVAVVEARLKTLDPGAKPADTPVSSSTPQNVNFAIKASYVRPLLEDLPDLGNYVLVKPVTGQDEMVAAARRAVFMVVVEH
jgi:S1-C subfamily serine protease